MNNYIKLNLFVAKDTVGTEVDYIVPTLVNKTKIIMIQDTSAVEQKYKSFIVLDGIDEGLRVVESPDEIMLL